MRIGQNPAKYVKEVAKPARVTLAVLSYIPFLSGFYSETLEVLKVCLESAGKDPGAEFDLLVFDPFLSAERAAELGVRQVSLEEAFEQGFVVSNHIADLPETRGMLRRDLFERMQPYATFINSGRGATVDEAGMCEVLAARPDLTALLDVTYPEPPLPDSPLFNLQNVLLTPHIAGSLGDEVLRQADYAIEESRRMRNGEPLRYAVTLEMLKRMA